MVSLIHHGGLYGVTGSCHQLIMANGRSLLIDCGLFQGRDEERHPSLHIEFSLQGVEALVLTHAHLDHVGRLPYLFAAGFSGPVFCSRPTAMLLPLMLEDALKVGYTRNRYLIEAFLDKVAQYLQPLDYDVWEQVAGGRIRLRRAGHILGSAYVEIDADGERTVFSGDLGAPYAPLLYAPRAPRRADTVVLESTYGNRVHEGRRQRRQRLEQVLVHTLENQGATIIPAFSLGRTQELLYELNLIFTRLQRRGYLQAPEEARSNGHSAPMGGRPDPSTVAGEMSGPDAAVGAEDAAGAQDVTGAKAAVGAKVAKARHPAGADGANAPGRLSPAQVAATLHPVDVIVDSPLASRFTQVYEDCAAFWDAEAQRQLQAGDQPLVFDNLMAVDAHSEHEWVVDYLRQHGRPAIVLAGSGMCTGGRVVNYLEALLPDERTDVLFVGYQAAGTPGRVLQSGGRRVRLNGREVDVRASAHTVSGYSAHADQRGLVNFVRRMDRPPGRVVLVHGEAAAREALERALQRAADERPSGARRP